MRPLVHVEAEKPGLPAQAANACCEWIFESLTARRAATVLVDASAPLPGATVTPWVLRGVLSALPAPSAGRQLAPLGDPSLAQRVFDAAGTPALAHAAAAELRSGPRLRLRVPGSPRDAAIPRAWIGSHLVFVTPVSHRRQGPTGHLGPAAAALASLARACRLGGSVAQLTRWGAQLARESFASATLVLDATWWAPLDEGGRPHGEAVAVEHCLASPSFAQRNAAEVLDAWLGSLLGHPPSPGGAGPFTPRIAGERRPWPRAPLPTAQRRNRGLAARAVEAMWARGQQRRRDTRRAALPPPTPGRFAAVWAREMR